MESLKFNQQGIFLLKKNNIKTDFEIAFLSLMPRGIYNSEDKEKITNDDQIKFAKYALDMLVLKKDETETN